MIQFLAEEYCQEKEGFYITVGGSSDEQLIKVMEVADYGTFAILVSREFVRKTPICISQEEPDSTDTWRMLGLHSTSTDDDRYLKKEPNVNFFILMF